jgi:hypothetical protein
MLLLAMNANVGWHREILDQRVKDLEANPEAGDSWDSVQERLRRALDRKPWIG